MRFKFHLSIILFCVLALNTNDALAYKIFKKSNKEQSVEIKRNDDKYKGKKKRNHASPAAKSAFSRQSKTAKRTVRRNNRYNKRFLSNRSKKQKRQKRFSTKNTFR